MFLPKKMIFLILIRCYFFDVFSYGFYTDLDDDELLGYFPLKLEEYNTSGDFAEMDIIFNRRVFCFIVFCNRYCWKQRNRYDALFPGVSRLFSGDFFRPLIITLPCLLVTFGQFVVTWARA